MGQLTFQAALGGSVNLVGPNTASTTNLTLPSADGTSGQLLSTNGSGTLSFTNVGAANGGTGLTSSGANGNILTSNGTTWVSQAPAAGITTSTTVSSATSITLTNSSAGYQYVTMTPMGQSVTLPDATTLAIGSPKFVIQNSGTYPFGIRDNSGTLIGAIGGGGLATLSLQSISTAAGVWGITGNNLQCGLIGIDAVLPNATWANVSTAIQGINVALDSNKSLSFIKNSSADLYVFAVDNTSKTVGTPVLILTATANLRAVFGITSTTAIVFYDDWSTNSYAVVVSLSGSTTLTVGTAASAAALYWPLQQPNGSIVNIAQLTTTLYVSQYTVSTTSVATVAVSVSGTTVTIGTPVTVETNTVSNSQVNIYPVSSTTAILFRTVGAAAPYSNKAVIASVSGKIGRAHV